MININELTTDHKIKLKKPMGCFDNLGEVCEIVKIDTDENVINFRFGVDGVHLGVMSGDELEKYFDVIDSKTENGIRKVPIADKVLPFYQRWLHDCSDCEYLIHTLDSQHFTYYMYYHNVFQPLMFRLHIDHTPHCCRHTTISLLAEAHVDQTTIKKIVGHSGAMSLTERIYTHLDVPALVEAINQI